MTPGALRRGGAARASLVILAIGIASCRAATPPVARASYRKTQRAYDGAPPVIPHAVEALQRQDCLTCHERGMRLDDGRLAPSTPHPRQTNCRQCHVEQMTPREGLARNTFVGGRDPARGSRAYAGAPPTIPHDLDGRSNCLGCHDTYGGSPIATPHPDRTNCLQCHVPMRPGTTAWRDNSFEGER